MKQTTHAATVSPPAEVELAALVGGELVATTRPRGRRAVVAFRSPYELVLTLGGAVVTHRPRPEDRRALIYVVRRLPALYAALEEALALVLDETAPGSMVAVDLYDRDAGCYLAHDALIKRCTRLDIPLPPFAPVPPVRHEAELRRTLAELTVMGPAVEVRREEEGIAVARAVFDHAEDPARLREHM